MFKKIFLVLALVSSFVFATDKKCDYEGFIRYFDKRIGQDQLMKGAKKEDFPPNPEDKEVRSSYTRTSVNKRTDGLIQVNSYLFTGCSLTEVWLENVDPMADNDTVRSVIAFLRPDSTLQAMCPDGRGMWKPGSPWGGSPTVNTECICYENFHKERKWRVGNTGCLESHDFDRIKKKFGYDRGDFR